MSLINEQKKKIIIMAVKVLFAIAYDTNTLIQRLILLSSSSFLAAAKLEFMDAFR
jgi:hypothetical protein